MSPVIEAGSVPPASQPLGADPLGADPLGFLAPLLSNPGSVFHFSFYGYLPDTASDERRLATLAGGSGALEAARALMGQAGPGEELAIHSTVDRGGRASHIPMVDFDCQGLGAPRLERLAKYLDPEVFASLGFFASGRSFHAYGSKLMEGCSLPFFLGPCLLANEPGSPSIVDARWVGHRLRAGYGALRLTRNAARSLSLPRRVDPLA